MSDEIEEVGEVFERGSYAVRANASSVQLFNGSCIIIFQDILFQVRERLRLMWDNM